MWAKIKPSKVLESLADHFFWNAKRNIFVKKPHKSPVFRNKSLFDLLHHLADTHSIILSQNFGCGTKIKPFRGLESGGGYYFETWNEAFLKKGIPKAHFLKKVRSLIYWIFKEKLSALFWAQNFAFGTETNPFTGLNSGTAHDFERRNETFFEKSRPKSLLFATKFASWSIGLSRRHSQHYFKPKMLPVGHPTRAGHPRHPTWLKV